MAYSSSVPTVDPEEVIGTVSVVMEILATIPLLVRVLVFLGALCIIAALCFAWRSSRRHSE